MQFDRHSRIAVIGAGTMGTGIAQLAAVAGHDVVVIDAQQAALDRGRQGMAGALEALVRRGRLEEAGRTAAEGRIRWTTELGDAAGSGLVIEAIIEQIDAKAALFAELARLLPGDAVLASNTSALSIGAIAANVPRPERVLGLHFFNPVPAMKLVEVIAAPTTSPSVRDAAAALMQSWGKRPVVVRDVPGFIVNRVARPYYAEGFAALAEGIGAAVIDHALTSNGGFRMGPLALADLIGNDVNYAVACSVHDAYGGVTRFRPQQSQRALVEAGRLGRKSGSGVYDYTGELPAPRMAAPGPAPRSIKVSAKGGTSVKLFRDAGLVVREDAALPFGFVCVDGVRFVMSDGRPLSVRDDADVLADVARDFAVANTIVLTARDDASAAVVAGLVQATGRSALIVPDRPGMIILRTLAQLANAAADAVADNVASLEAIDEAMVYGANHPEGPLNWAERAGNRRVAQALSNIAEATGDAMYRPAELLVRS